jgi:hypothetical protein
MNGSLAMGVLAIAVAVPTGSSMAQDRDRLEGWGPFKFSMSRAQAIEAIKPGAYFYGSPFIGYDTEIDGARWHAVVEFSDDQSVINKIRLQQGTIASLMGQSAPRKEIVTKEACLSRVGRLEPQLTRRYGAPDRTFDHSETQDANRHVSYDGVRDRFDHSETTEPPYFYRHVRYDFKDGARIEIIAVYSPPGPGGRKDDHFCDLTIQYFPFRAIPKSTF